MKTSFHCILWFLWIIFFWIIDLHLCRLLYVMIYWCQPCSLCSRFAYENIILWHWSLYVHIVCGLLSYDNNPFHIVCGLLSYDNSPFHIVCGLLSYDNSPFHIVCGLLYDNSPFHIVCGLLSYDNSLLCIGYVLVLCYIIIDDSECHWIVISFSVWHGYVWKFSLQITNLSQITMVFSLSKFYNNNFLQVKQDSSWSDFTWIVNYYDSGVICDGTNNYIILYEPKLIDKHSLNYFYNDNHLFHWAVKLFTGQAINV